MNQVVLVGVLNCTPDSFSDGGTLPTVEAQLSHARKLIEDGASVIDIGGDSTRPGSVCVGIEEEWRRIEPIISRLAKETAVSVDTHHPEVARRALEVGAAYINDISGGSDEMFAVVSKFKARLTVMYSRCSMPHLFDRPPPADFIADIENFFHTRIARASRHGLPRAHLLFDPGMGGFLSANPADSFAVIQHIKKLAPFSPIFLGVSRKGFLKLLTDEDADARDAISAFLGAEVAKKLVPNPTFIRVHNVKLQKQFLKLYSSF